MVEISLDLHAGPAQDVRTAKTLELFMVPLGRVSLSIAVVSDDRLLSDTLVESLSAQPDIVAAPCASAFDASLVSLTRAFDIALVDARNYPTMALGAAVPDHPLVIFVGASEDDAWAAAALSAGARGILTRAASRDDLVGAIRVVHGGGIWARRRWLNQCILNGVGASKRRLAAQDVADSRLSRREREVLGHAATGVCNKVLANRLSISEATVKVHLSRIFQKLGVTGRAALAATYHDLGAFDPVTRPPGRTTPAAQNHPSG
jgi:DNA-binding NarL/FixJ family response regulator